MPTPERTTLPAVVAAATALLESGGESAVTMAAVAKQVGVRAPSLYKRVQNRDDLIRLVAESILSDVVELMQDPSIVGQKDPAHRLLELARALRAFAHARPAAYRLIFAPGEVQVDRALLESASAPLLAIVSELTGGEGVLEAARTVTAWAVGFITMELNGAFRLGEEIDAAFAYGAATVIDAIAFSPGSLRAAL